MPTILRNMRSLLTTGIGFVLLLTAIAAPALALEDVPEIDAGSLTSAIGLLVGGAYLLTDRIRRKS